MRTQRISHRDAGQNRTPAVPKRRFTAAPACALAIALSAATICPPTAIAQQAILASPRNTVIPPTEFAAHPAISADGRHVAFMTQDLSTYPFFGPMSQIYVFSQVTGQIAIVSSSNGLASGLGAAKSENPAISSNGRYVAFRCLSQLVPSGSGVFILDRDADNDGIFDELGSGRSLRVGSTSNASNASNFSDSDQPAFSATGRYMAFISKTTTLVPGGANTGNDVYIKDRDFDANGIFDEFGAGVHKTIRVSVSSAGQPANNPSNAAHPVLSADGRFVAYESDASNLVADDTNGLRDIFLHDRDTDADHIFDEPGAISTVRVSVAADGTQSDSPSYDPTISGDGRYVAFVSGASNMVPGLTRHPFPQIYLFDRITHDLQLISRTSAGTPSSAYCVSPSLNDDGSMLAFSSTAVDLVQFASAGYFGVFIWRRNEPLLGLSYSTPPVPPEFGMVEPILARNERRMAVTSMSRNLAEDGAPTVRDVFILDALPCVPQPSISTPVINLCAGTGVTLHVDVPQSGPFEFQWFRDGIPLPGESSDSFSIQYAQTSDSGQYAVRVTSACASVMSNSAAVSVFAAPVITTQPASVAFCAGFLTPLTVAAVGVPPFGFQWFWNGIAINGADSSTYDAGAEGDYYVIVTDACGATQSTVATCTYLFQPQITSNPVSVMACPNTDVSFQVAAVGQNLAFQWLRNQVAIPGATQSILTIHSPGPADIGSYVARVSNECGTAQSNAATLSVSQQFSSGCLVWSQLTPATSPAPRSRHALLFDAARHQTSLFGGVTVDPDDAIWLWNGADWQPRAPSPRPPQRSAFGSAYDSARAQIVIFGGLSRDGVILNDTWIWNGSEWTLQLPVGGSPLARHSTAMAYDAIRDRIVLFGGRDSFNLALFDTWEWNGDSWTQSAPAISPTPRFEHAMEFDPVRQKIIMCGGSSGSTETWEYGGSTWVRLTNSPIASRRNHSMTFVLWHNAAWVYGNSIAADPTILAFYQSAWTSAVPASSPLARYGSAMTYDADRETVVMFGGLRQSNNAILGDTWELRKR